MMDGSGDKVGGSWDQVGDSSTELDTCDGIRKVQLAKSATEEESTLESVWLSDALDDYDDPVPPPSTANTYKPRTIIGSTECDDDLKGGPSFQFDVVDAHARKVPDSVTHSFDDLLDYFKEIIKRDIDRDLWMIRSILVWISCQNFKDIEGRRNIPADFRSPKGAVQMMREGQAGFSVLFTLLCRKAALTCVRIGGKLKPASFKPGEDNVLEQGHWNAVQVNGNWHLIYPRGCCVSVAGRTDHHGGDGFVSLEGDTFQMSAVNVNMFQDDFFLVRPHEFIHIALPHDSNWQLLPKEQIRTEERFLKQPYLPMIFFQYGLKLVDCDSCCLIAKLGTCKIEIEADERNSKQLCAKYDLFAKKSSIMDSGFLKPGNRQRLVFSERCGKRFSFEVRFPMEGAFLLAIHFGLMSQLETAGCDFCCEFHIECHKKQDNCRLLPIDPGVIGWGPGPFAEEVGLTKPSVPSGRIYVDQTPPLRNAPTKHNTKKTNQKENRPKVAVDFNVDPSKSGAVKFDAELSSDCLGNISVETKRILKECVETKLDKTTQKFYAVASIPKDGEYALTILAAESKPGVKTIFKKVCHYLITTEMTTAERAEDLRRKLRMLLKGENADALEKSITEYMSIGLDESEELFIFAKEKLVTVTKNMLQTAVAKENDNILQSIIIDIDVALKRLERLGIPETDREIRSAKDRKDMQKRKSEAKQMLRDATREASAYGKSASRVGVGASSEVSPQELKDKITKLINECRTRGIKDTDDDIKAALDRLEELENI